MNRLKSHDYARLGRILSFVSDIVRDEYEKHTGKSAEGLKTSFLLDELHGVFSSSSLRPPSSLSPASSSSSPPSLSPPPPTRPRALNFDCLAPLFSSRRRRVGV